MSEDPEARKTTGEVTRILNGASAELAKQDVLPLIYGELKKIAGARMARERGDHTLQATALVHEAYVRLVGDQRVSWEGRGSFFGAASEAMRRILIDHARKRATLRRGGDRSEQSITRIDPSDDPGAGQTPEDLLALDDALSKLEREDPRAAQVVQLRFFGGLDIDKTAEVIGISRRTVLREWEFARARLQQLLAGG